MIQAGDSPAHPPMGQHADDVSVVNGPVWTLT